MLLRLLIALTVGFLFESNCALASPLCQRFYEGDRVPAGPVLSSISTLLELGDGEIAAAVQRYNGKRALSEDEIQKMQTMDAEFRKAMRENSELTPQLVAEVVRDMRSIGFFMGPFHEDMVRDGLRGWSRNEGEVDQYFEAFSSNRAQDKDVRRWAVSKTIDRIAETVKKFKKDEEKDIKRYFKYMHPRVNRLSKARLERLLNVLEETITDPKRKEIFEIILDNSMYDIAKIIKARKLGLVSEITGRAAAVLLSLGPVSIGLYGGFVDHAYIDYFGRMSVMVPVLTMGQAILTSMVNYFNYREDQRFKILGFKNMKKLGGIFTSAPKESTVFWRRWKQRWNVNKNTDREIALNEKNFESEITFDQVIEQIKGDIDRDLSNPVNISVWTYPLGEMIDRLISAQTVLSHKHDKIIASPSPKKMNQEELAQDQKDLKQLQFEYNELSQDILVLSQALDMYQQKAVQIINSDTLVEDRHRHFVIEKQKYLRSAEGMLRDVATIVRLRNTTLAEALNIHSVATLGAGL